MDYPVELCRLVIRNLDIVETLPEVLSSLETRFFTSVNARVEERVKRQGRNLWKGYYNFAPAGEEEDTSFALSVWPDAGNGDYAAYFTLGYTEEGEAERDRWFSRAAGVKGSALCLRFEADYAAFGLKPREYRQRLAAFYAANPALAQAGFHISSYTEGICRPFSFEAEKLAAACPDFGEILTPLDEALDDLFKVQDSFDAFVRQLAAELPPSCRKV
ncbi:MAG: hypothetical protein LBQ63_00765 [Deltaproteobacteria bacterium]|nr:hypothetical protein [Deltaproteobacteria bacterium]